MLVLFHKTYSELPPSCETFYTPEDLYLSKYMKFFLKIRAFFHNNWTAGG